MAERSRILDLWHTTPVASGVLVTVARVEGSSYRMPGARMYVNAGRYGGSISGGCLEGDVIRKSQWLTRAGAALQTYSTFFDNPFDRGECPVGAGVQTIEDKEIPYGLGCGGVIDLLLEPARLAETDAMLRALEASGNGEIFFSATVLPECTPTAGGIARVLVRADGSLFFGSDHLSPAATAQLATLAGDAAAAQWVSVDVDGAKRSVFLEPILPPQRLVIFGAGDDAQPLARMASQLGWRVAVADGRPWLAQASRFPEAMQVMALEENRKNLASLQLGPEDAVALLTHSFEQDKKLLRELLPLGLRYLGLLGARNRSRLLLTEVAHELGWPVDDCLARVSAPIGLDLGGDGPEAVALTILAEIQSVLHGKNLRAGMPPAELFEDSRMLSHVRTSCRFDEPR